MEFKQEMPPPGGYAPIVYKKVPLKPGFNIYLKFGALVGLSALGWIGYHHYKRIHNLENIENRCVRLALSPMLHAERDRMLLKQLKRNRDAEERIMKDVEGWEVGKWKNMPVYSSVGPDEFYMPTSHEYYAHTDDSYANRTICLTFYT